MRLGSSWGPEEAGETGNKKEAKTKRAGRTRARVRRERGAFMNISQVLRTEAGGVAETKLPGKPAVWFETRQIDARVFADKTRASLRGA
jgi:hypothetical protein